MKIHVFKNKVLEVLKIILKVVKSVFTILTQTDKVSRLGKQKKVKGRTPYTLKNFQDKKQDAQYWQNGTYLCLIAGILFLVFVVGCSLFILYCWWLKHYYGFNLYETFYSANVQEYLSHQNIPFKHFVMDYKNMVVSLARIHPHINLAIPPNMDKAQFLTTRLLILTKAIDPSGTVPVAIKLLVLSKDSKVQEMFNSIIGLNNWTEIFDFIICNDPQNTSLFRDNIPTMDNIQCLLLLFYFLLKNIS